MYELTGRIGSAAGTFLLDLPVYERELLRCALLWPRPFRLADVSGWLHINKVTGRKVIRELEAKELIVPEGGSENRCHAFMLTDKAVSLLLDGRCKL